MSADFAGLDSLRIQALCKKMGSHDAQLLSDFAAVVVAVGDGRLDSDDLDAVMSSDSRTDALRALASLPSVRSSYTAARVRDRYTDHSRGRFAAGM